MIDLATYNDYLIGYIIDNQIYINILIIILY